MTTHASAQSQQGSQPLWILAGPTACGKTAAALALAHEADVEIISVDSALIYRGMDIGTAKPTREEQARVPHHLIDIIDPAESYSAARFVQDTNRLIGEIRARGHTPLLVGGTMLYIKALLEGLDDMPPASREIRAVLDARMAELGSAALHAELATVDPVTAARLAPGDTQRIQRALEVWHATGRPLSSFHLRNRAAEGASAGAPTGDSPTDDRASHERAPAHRAILVSLEPEDRAWLHARIALRFEQMMQAGFIDEVRALRQRPDLHAGLPSIRCVGYRQVWEALDAGQDLSRPEALREVMDKGIAATRQLAKRQVTWLRGMPDRIAIACDQPHALGQVKAAFLG